MKRSAIIASYSSFSWRSLVRSEIIRKKEIQGAAARSGGAGAPQTHVLARQRLRHEKIGQCRAA